MAKLKGTLVKLLAGPLGVVAAGKVSLLTDLPLPQLRKQDSKACLTMNSRGSIAVQDS